MLLEIRILSSIVGRRVVMRKWHEETWGDSNVLFLDLEPRL